MTPADITGNASLAIYQGAKWEHVITFTETNGGAALDRTGYTFSLEFFHPTRKTLLFEGSAELTTDGSDGKVTLLATAAQTDDLSLGQVWVGLRDHLNNPYMVGILNVKYFPNDPA